MMKNNTNNALDAMLLAGVRILTLLIGIISTSVLSHALSLEMYGTYTSANLIVSTATLLTIFGFMDASNYFYNRGGKMQEEYIATIFTVEIVIGVFCAGILWVGKPLLLRYFDNYAINAVYGLIIFRPLLQNLGDMLLTLQTAIGKTRIVAIRNMFFAVLKLVAVVITAFFLKSLKTIFTALLLLDILTILFYYFNFKKIAFPIQLRRFTRKLLKEILVYSLPLGIYLLMASVVRDIDKYVIALFESTERFAIYSNCAALLPFNVISSAFLTVSMPIMTRLIKDEQFTRSRMLFKAYLKIGYLTTVTFTAIAMVLAREIILLLYGEKYLPGISVFVLYTIVDMVKFAGVTLVLSAAGKTKTLMYISFGTVAANLLLDLAFYRLMGFDGPAIATALLSLIVSGLMLKLSANEIHSKLVQLFDMKEIGQFLLQLLGLSAVAYLAESFLRRTGVHFALILLLVGGGFCGAVIVLQKKKLIEAMKIINLEKITAAGLNNSHKTEIDSSCTHISR